MGHQNVTTEKRLRQELTEKDRYTLELCLKRGDNVASISSLLCFHPKTILREIVNGTVTLLDTNLLEYSCYKANYAQGIKVSIEISKASIYSES